MDEIEHQVFKAIDSGRGRMIRTLQDLLKIDTQVPPGHDYDKICEILEEKYNHLGYTTSLHEASEKYMKSGAKHICLEGPRTNLVARLNGEGDGPTLHISAHTDTAAIQKQGWSVTAGGEVTKPASTAKATTTREADTSGVGA
jgi:succinyl-diaminopimelate desuccinylase